jgi:hypothetical protein
MTEDYLREHRRFASMMEQSIRAVNREIMHPIVDPLTEDKVLSVSIEVAKRRAKYIDLTLQLGDASENQPSAEELNKARDNYIAARDAFAELMRTIEQGYVDLPSKTKKAN